MLTQAKIERLAHQFGLTVTKTIMTGDDSAHFADFVLAGEQTDVAAAWHWVIDNHLRPPIGYGECKPSDHGNLCIKIKSVWCEPGIKETR